MAENKEKIIPRFLTPEHIKEKDLEKLLEENLSNINFEKACLLYVVLEDWKNDKLSDLWSKTVNIDKEKLLNQAKEKIIEAIILNWKDLEEIKNYWLTKDDISSLIQDLESWNIERSREVAKKIMREVWDKKKTIDDLINNLEKLWYSEKEAKDILHKMYLNNTYFPNTPGEVEKLWNKYKRLISEKTADLSQETIQRLEQIKNEAYQKIMESQIWREVMENFVKPLYEKISWKWKDWITKAREEFEQITSKMMDTMKQVKNSLNDEELFEAFKTWWIFKAINVWIEKLWRLDKGHKEALKMILDLAAIAWAFYWIFKYFKKVWFWKWLGILVWWEFVYNYMTGWKHSLVDLIGAIFTWGLDESYLISTDEQEKVKASWVKVIDQVWWKSVFEKAKVNVEIKNKITDPLFVALLFGDLTVNDLKKNWVIEGNKVNLDKLKEFLEKKSKEEHKPEYWFAYSIVDAILKSDNKDRKEELKESIISWLDIIWWFENSNKSISGLYESYSERLTEITKFEEKFYEWLDDLKDELWTSKEDIKKLIDRFNNKLKPILIRYLKWEISKQDLIKEIKRVAEEKFKIKTKKWEMKVSLLSIVNRVLWENSVDISFKKEEKEKKREEKKILENHRENIFKTRENK